MIDTKALRSRVLDLAIQGKLTEQLDSDGTAEELYQQIQAEKQKLVKEGKIKKEKPLPEITADDIPFEIPSNWKWVRIIEIGVTVTGCTPSKKQADNYGGKYPFFKPADLDGGIHITKASEYLSDIGKAASRQLKKGTILVCCIGSLGKCAIIGTDGTCNQQINAFTPYICSSEYLYFAISNSFFTFQLNQVSRATTLEIVNKSKFDNCIIPLPPLAEQKRIVERVEEIFSVLDTIDEAQEKYSADATSLRSKLITAGIQGSLTQQLDTDGTAEELYQQIQAEKQKLIKEGKLKKEKPLPPISPEEIPFEIPQNWKWVRISDIFMVGTGSTPSKNEKKYYNGGDIPWVNSALTVNRYIDRVNTCITKLALDSLNLKLYPEHTLIIAMYGEGKTRGQISELLIPATTNQACAAMTSIIYNQGTIDYVYYFFQNYYDNLRALAHGGNQPNLNLQKIKDVLIPLPPLAEQKRIADVLEKAMGAIS